MVFSPPQREIQSDNPSAIIPDIKPKPANNNTKNSATLTIRLSSQTRKLNLKVLPPGGGVWQTVNDRCAVALGAYSQLDSRFLYGRRFLVGRQSLYFL